MESSLNPKVITAIQDKPTIESYDDGSSKMRVKMLNGENWMQWFEQPNKQTLSGATPTRMTKEDEIDKQFKQMESNIQLLLKLHNRDYMSQANEGSSLSSINDDVDGKSGFYVGEGINKLANNKSNQTFILNTGASTTNISNFELLIDPKPSKMSVKTFSGSASITHTGKLNFNGTIIQPVFYALNGNTNLISPSQLEDQGIRVFHKNQKLILKSGERIVMEFLRQGKLYISCIKPSINHVEMSSKKDWHILLGHLSDKYLKKFLKYNNMPSFDTEYATKCKICTQ
ncbi:hypothetical protein O181_084171 [Austropuccinia psidii MF-1]|uniref:GAG-pre-integrase domain-containing protein n=1 Tax=Austropuccinia psidii MF-1 TaxID=1389203 RepID=A0A9Q3FQG3_9BASI|nr:hypothetical protein [Austropuccinia psidii MF-1]